MSLYYVSVTLHVLAALVWLGGMLFLGLVGAPVLRRVEPPELRAQLFRDLGMRFRAAGWIAIGVLVATGVLNLALRGVLSTELLGSTAFWQSRYGVALAWKLGLVVLMIALAAWHDFVLGPRSAAVAPGSEAAALLRRRAALTARVNAIAGIVLIIVAVRLARGG